MPELRLGLQIFISHSSADKNFVRFLAKELRHHWYNPFFDEHSLPKAKEASMQNILIEAQKCKLALLVLTPEFFTRTRNPMMEVIACVESNVPLLPLFYKLTVDQVKRSRDLFRQKWIEQNANDHCPDIANKWSNAFKKLLDFNGLEYGSKSTNEADFVEEVADNVYRILPPDNQRDDTHIVGKERLSKIVEHKFYMSPNVEHGIKVLGLHGMEGMGKTTLCEALCNFYLTEFKGRVCHVKLHEGSQHDRINSILLQLGPRSDAYSKRSSIEALKHLETVLSTSKFFLVLDDIQDSYQSDKDEIGRLLLNRIKDIPMGTKLLFLARRSSVLRNVLSLLPESNDSHIHPFPGLILDEAKLILCKEFPRLFPDNGMNDPQQIDFLNQCTELCTPTSGSGIYNPLMLKLLASNFLVKKWNSIVKASQARSNGMPHLTGLKKYLTALKGDRSRGMKEFFDKLQASFNSQIKEYQEPFLDLALFTPGKDAVSKQLCLRRDKKAVKEILEKLRDASFLLDDYGMHDVHRELAKRIARESTEVFYAEHRELKGADLRDIFENNRTRVAFVNCTFRMVKADLDLSRCDSIQVLLLDGNKGLGSVILAVDSPQSIEVRSVTAPQLVHSVAKQEIIEASSLHNRISPFTYFRCLVVFDLGGIGDSSWSFDAAQLNHCHSLEILQLYNINLQMGTWELPCWPQLRELKLSQLHNLEILSGLERSNTLRKLHLSRLNALISLSNVQSLEKLTAVVLGECERVSELSLPSSLQHCSIEKCDTLRKIDVMGDRQDLRAETETESSDEECLYTENYRLVIKDCGNLQEIIGLVDSTSMHSSVYSARERGQPSSFQDFDFRRTSMGESWRISYMEFHKSPSTWQLHGLAVEQVERNGYVQEQVERNGYVQELGKLLGDAVGLKTLKWVCAKSGFCGCRAIPPKFHLLPSLESLEYHCSNVTDLSTIRQCPRLRSLCVDGCINAQG